MNNEPPSFDLTALSEEEQLEAARMARVAELAELRANERRRLQARLSSPTSTSGATPSTIQLSYISKEERERRRLAQEQAKQVATAAAHPVLLPPPPPPQAPALSARLPPPSRPSAAPLAGTHAEPAKKKLTKKQLERIKFKFDWDEDEDTLLGQEDNLEAHVAPAPPPARDRFLEMADARQKLHTGQSKHWKDKTLEEMTKRDWAIVREDFDIRIRGPNPPNPARSWEEMGLPLFILKSINQAGFTAPTAIQMQGVPAGLSGRDVIGVAETGSGKTAAFVLPFFAFLFSPEGRALRPRCAEEGPLGVILAPTRELAQQIEADVKMLSACAPEPVRSVVVVGGNSAETQGFYLREGCDIVAATPGRLIDVLESRLCVLNQCRFVVLDEADRMIDMGFEPQVARVFESLVLPQNQRQVIMFTATMSPTVEALAHKFIKPQPLIVNVGDADAGTGHNPNIEQQVVVVATELARERELVRALSQASAPIIVFCNEKTTCDLVARALRGQTAHKVVVLHSGRSQDEREANLKGFRDGAYGVLVATDVAGRGLDVDDVQLVLNYDAPTTLDRYKHRIGRTGRAGKKGRALTLVMPGKDQEFIPALTQFMVSCGFNVPPEMRALGAEGEGEDEDEEGFGGGRRGEEGRGRGRGRGRGGGRGGRGDKAIED